MQSLKFNKGLVHMYNTDIPTRAELPSTKQLLRSTLIAIASAAAILVAVVLPAEYNVDPTGIGRVLGLAEMGEIKAQLAKEAEDDRLKTGGTTDAAKPDQESSLLGEILTGLFISSAHAEDAPATRKDEMTISLTPGEGKEIKLKMIKGEKVNFTWIVEGGVVNFDLHGDNGAEQISYEKGRGQPKAEGVLEAAFDGNHGWFWRNRGDADVKLTLKTDGAYSDIKEMK
jgi:hypothetical protein